MQVNNVFMAICTKMFITLQYYAQNFFGISSGFNVDIKRKKIYNSVELGPVAQLGECYIRIVEVVGSTPIGSTKK